jgi:2-keto-3-deoxy-L-rhamnonate aldolase RhmA
LFDNAGESAMKDIWSAMDAGEVVIGHWVASGSPTMVEIIGHSGADVVAIDCEHGPLSPYGAELEACIRAAYAADVTPIVRIASQDGAQVSRAADFGAKGVIVPHVNTADQLRRMLSHAKLPPDGNRGCGPNVRAAAYGFQPWPEFLAATNASVEVVPLLEEPAAFECLDEILAVEGLRAVAIGPFDLAMRLGGVGTPDAERRVRECLDALLAAARPRAISVIDGAWDLDTFARKVQAGCRGIMYSGDTVLLAAALREQVGALRDHLAGGRGD